ncbi:MAG: hypothetical protein IJZ42_07190 [Lachnospiraceae bacterium]|nr:hypothetical protein [Lachnospiraceae bacterium]
MTREEVLQARRDKEKITLGCKVPRYEYDKIKEFCADSLKIGITEYCRIAIFEKLERDGFVR